MSDHSKLELKRPKLFAALERLDADLYAQVKSVARMAEDYLERIPRVFPTYTQHNIEHSIRILDTMYELLGPALIPGEAQEAYELVLSPLEIAMLIYGALLHDIGMAPDDATILAIKNNTLDGYANDYGKFVERFGGNETFALQDYVRRIHAELSGRYVRLWFGDWLHVPGQKAISYANEVALLCESHNYGIDWCKSKLPEEAVKGPYKCNFQFCALLLRLGDILDFDARRTPYHLFKSIDLTAYSRDEWAQHLVVESTGARLAPSSMIEGWQSPVFHGRCSDPAIYRKVLGYFDWIETEIRQGVLLAQSFRHAQYRLRLALPLVNRIQTAGFQVANQQLRIDYDAISQLLMGEHIYGDRLLGVRELLQNAIDACRLRREAEAKRASYEERYTPRIRIILDQPRGKLVFKDNGAGMNDFIINEFFLNIGKSYYRSDEFLLKHHDFQPTGRFGIGFLSCFMLADRVTVKTKHYTESVVHELELDKSSKYIVRRTAENAGFRHGTEIVLDYDFATNPLELTAEQLKAFVEKHFLLDERWVYVEDVGAGSQVAVVSDRAGKWGEILEMPSGRRIGSDCYTKIYASVDAHFHDVTGFIELGFPISRSTLTVLDQNFIEHECKDDLFVGYLDKTGIRPMEERFLSECVDDLAIQLFHIRFIDPKGSTLYSEALSLLQNESATYSELRGEIGRGTLFVNKELAKALPSGRLIAWSQKWEAYGTLRKYLQQFGYEMSNLFADSRILIGVHHPTANQIILLNRSRNLLILEKKIKKDRLFINQVFVNDMQTADIMLAHPLAEPGSCLLNTNHALLKSNVGRNGMPKESENLLRYAIYKFVHYLALSYYKSDLSLAWQIRCVIERLYAEKSPLLKEETLLNIQYEEKYGESRLTPDQWLSQPFLT